MNFNIYTTKYLEIFQNNNTVEAYLLAWRIVLNILNNPMTIEYPFLTWDWYDFHDKI